MPSTDSSFVRGEFCIESRPDPAGVIIFGASGDLTSRKLIPALYNLHRRKLLPKGFYVLGCARTEMSDDTFRDQLMSGLKEFVSDMEEASAREFLQKVFYRHGNYDDSEFYGAIAATVKQLDKQHETKGNRLFYLSVPPSLYGPIADHLSKSKLTRESERTKSWARVIVEKPFGRDLESGLALDHELHNALREHQIYRIDHYLGKETVQNILMFRFANSIFEPLWNRQVIDHVQITVGESVGIGHRAGYFEQAGVLRDMFQNHMLQMLALVAMEAPASFDDNRVRDEKVKLLRSIRPFETQRLDEQIVRGQYVTGLVDGKPVKGYREEKGVADQSMVETYVAMKIMIDNWRWQGVPFYLRSGKRLPKRVSEISIHFKNVPHSMFQPIKPEELEPNVLVFNVQPDEGIRLSILGKHPGPKLCMTHMHLNFDYRREIEEEPPEAYERLLLDGLLGDQTLFIRSDDMQVAWSLFTPVLKRWESEGSDGHISFYEPGSWGPKIANELLSRDGRRWRNP